MNKLCGIKGVVYSGLARQTGNQSICRFGFFFFLIPDSLLEHITRMGLIFTITSGRRTFSVPGARVGNSRSILTARVRTFPPATYFSIALQRRSQRGVLGF